MIFLVNIFWLSTVKNRISLMVPQVRCCMVARMRQIPPVHLHAFVSVSFNFIVFLEVVSSAKKLDIIRC
jgi:hypothetical protein